MLTAGRASVLLTALNERRSVTPTRNRRQNGSCSFVYFSVYVFQVGEGNAKCYEVNSRKDSPGLLMNGSQTRGPRPHL